MYTDLIFNVFHEFVDCIDYTITYYLTNGCIEYRCQPLELIIEEV